MPPVDEALYLNCDLLFALAEQLDISVDEQKKIDAILHENGEPVFFLHRHWMKSFGSSQLIKTRCSKY